MKVSFSRAFLLVAGLLVVALILLPGSCQDRPAVMPADTTYHRTLPELPRIKPRPVAPVVVQISLAADTTKRRQVERKPVITRIRTTPLRKRKELVEVDYIDPAGIETRVITELPRGTWEVRGDTIAPVLQDRRSRRREWWRKAGRTAKHVAIVAGAAAGGVALGKAID